MELFGYVAEGSNYVFGPIHIEKPTQISCDIDVTVKNGNNIIQSTDYKLLDEGKATVNGEEMTVNVGDSDTGSFASKMATVLSSVCAIFSRMMSNMTLEGG